MNIGERIRYFRKLNKMTQKELGLKIGYNERTACIRIFQYEMGRRFPKPETLKRFADIFGVSVHVFETADIDNEMVLIHTLFALENERGVDLKTSEKDISFCFDKDKENNAVLFKHLQIWQEMKIKYENGEISKEEYEKWKNSYSNNVHE